MCATPPNAPISRLRPAPFSILLGSLFNTQEAVSSRGKENSSKSISRLQQGQHLFGSLFQPSDGARLLRKAHEGLARLEPSMGLESTGMAYLWGRGWAPW